MASLQRTPVTLTVVAQQSNTQIATQQRRFDWFLLLLFVLTLPFVNPWVRGDGVGYYAYARAPLIEHSLDFTRDYHAANDSFREARIDEYGQVRPEYITPTGRLDNHFTVGPAMLWSPFLLLAHSGVLLARHMGSQVAADGFSAPYRYVMAFGTALYGFLGLWLSFRLARKYVSALWAFVAALAIWWASSLPVYMYFNPSWSHAHSAFVCALFLWYWDRTQIDRTTAQWLLLGLLAGLMLDVYYPNGLLLTVLVIEAIGQYRSAFIAAASFSAEPLRLLGRHILFAAAACVALIPTFVTRTIVYGGPLKTGYYSFSIFLWKSPMFLSVLFSSNHGLLSWTPLLFFAIVGLVLFASRFPNPGVPFVLALVAFYLFICVYPDWAGISSYGNRFFISLTPLFILGLAYLLQIITFRLRWPRMALATTSAVLACFVLWNFGLIYQWGVHMVPARGPISFRTAAYNQFFVVPGRITSTIQHYVFHRGDLMREIEDKDMNQLNDDTEAPESR